MNQGKIHKTLQVNFGGLAWGIEGKGKGMNGTVVIMEYCGLLADEVGLMCGLEYRNPVRQQAVSRGTELCWGKPSSQLIS